jgi:hypothetical protein
MAVNYNTGNLGGDLRGVMPSPDVIALTDLPGNRKVIKKLEDQKYLKVEGGFIVPGDPSGGQDRDKYPGPMTEIGEDFAGDSGKDADGNHSHPDSDVSGGDLYLIDEYPAISVNYYVTDTMISETSYRMINSPPAAWDFRGLCTPGGGYIGPY